MGADELGLWEPLMVTAVVALFRPASFRWWLAGGHALDAHVGRQWRTHGDLDIGITRTDAVRLSTVLDGWDIHVAADGVLTPWDGQPLDDRSDRAGNNLWCRPSPDGPWALDILVGDGDEHEWAYRRDPSIRRPWPEAVLTSSGGLPYLAPELQLLFKSTHMRPNDDADAAVVVPALESERRTWLADHLHAEHAWQALIAERRAQLAVENVAGHGSAVHLLSSGRSSQAWGTVDRDPQLVMRVPIPNSGRLISYRSEALLGELLADGGHPVSRWRLETVDDVECSIGTMLHGSAIGYATDWSPSFAAALAATLHDLHRLPATGWGPLANTSDALEGSAESATGGIVDRWSHAPIWPFDGTDLTTHPVTALGPGIVPMIATLREAILAAAVEPFGVVHSDLHDQHLLHVDGELSGVLDFGDAFVGSTAWDFGLIHWYYGADNAHRVAEAYGTDADEFERGATLAVAIGCHKMAKTPDDPAIGARLRSLLTS